MQAETVNSKAADDMLLASNMAQQIMTEASGVATEKEKISVKTKAVFSLLKNNASNRLYSENHNIQC